MKTLTLTVLSAVALAVAAFTSTPTNAEQVRGYTKKNGQYVQPYYRSKRDSNPYNNYSTKGNSNPYTGKKGYVDPYKAQRKRTW